MHQQQSQCLSLLQDWLLQVRTDPARFTPPLTRRYAKLTSSLYLFFAHYSRATGIVASSL